MKEKIPKAKQEIIDTMEDSNPEAMWPTGHANAIVGIVSRCGSDDLFLMDSNIIHQNLMKEGMTEEEAMEFFDYNIIGSYNGTGTPYYLGIDYCKEV